MPEPYMRQSVLAHRHLEARASDDPNGAGVVLCERAHLGKVLLRGAAADPAFVKAVEGVLGAAPPLRPNTVVETAPHRILWCGPDEWLVVTKPFGGTDLCAQLVQALVAVHSSAVVVTDSRGVIGLWGARAREVLAKGSPMDFHPRVFGPGQCVQTLLGKASVLIHQRDDTALFDIYVMRSYADYLWRWLEDAGAEFGTAVGRG